MRVGMTIMACLMATALFPAPGTASQPGCSKRDIRNLVHDFIPAYNRGKIRRLNRIFASEPAFLGYYAAPERTYESGEDRATLMGYFRHRHEVDDRLNLDVFWIQKEREPDGSYDFYFELKRESHDSDAQGAYVGKGNAGYSDANCHLRLWNMTPNNQEAAPDAAANRCNPKLVRRVVHSFIRTYNVGDIAALEQLFPPQEEFGQYRAWPEREWPDSQDRSTLMNYFRDRHSRKDVFKLRSLTMSRRRSPDGSCGIGVVLIRVSDDPYPWGDGTFSGKGGVKPEAGHVFSLNMHWSP